MRRWHSRSDPASRWGSRQYSEDLGVSLTDAIDYATINPAKALGVEKDLGSIAVGKKASFTILDKEYNVVMTIVNGNIVYKKED